jgi:hypothetical protein
VRAPGRAVLEAISTCFQRECRSPLHTRSHTLAVESESGTLGVIAIVSLAALFPTFWLLNALTGSTDFAAWAAIAISLMGLPILLLSRWRGGATDGKLHPESDYVVAISPDAIEVVAPDGHAERVLLADLREVVVETNDTGPWGADVWWHLIGSLSRIAFPQGATGEPAVLDGLQKLPGFDNQELIRAMGSTSNASFVCWRLAGNSPERAWKSR